MSNLSAAGLLLLVVQLRRLRAAHLPDRRLYRRVGWNPFGDRRHRHVDLASASIAIPSAEAATVPHAAVQVAPCSASSLRASSRARSALAVADRLSPTTPTTCSRGTGGTE